MTETPSNQEGFGPPDEEGIESAKVGEQLATDPDQVPNAPNRPPDEPVQDGQQGRSTGHWSGRRPRDASDGTGADAAADRDPERRSKPTPQHPIDRPGPLNPGEEDRDLPTGVESYERPGRDGNWERSDD